MRSAKIFSTSDAFTKTAPHSNPKQARERSKSRELVDRRRFSSRHTVCRPGTTGPSSTTGAHSAGAAARKKKLFSEPEAQRSKLDLLYRHKQYLKPQLSHLRRLFSVGQVAPLERTSVPQRRGRRLRPLGKTQGPTSPLQNMLSRAFTRSRILECSRNGVQ